jgi:hypothetical protein
MAPVGLRVPIGHLSLLSTALVAALVLPSSARAGDACSTTARGHAKAQLTKERRPPLIVGDSTMLFAAPRLGERGLQADARGCRQFAAGVRLLDARRRSGTLPRISILALGANGSVSATAIRKALATIGPRRILGLVTPRRSAGSAAQMRRAARRHPERVLLIDWERHSSGRGGWFFGDGLHVNHTGALAFARFVQERMAPIADPPVRSLDLPRSPEGTEVCGIVRRGGVALRVRVVRGARRITCGRAVRLALHSPLRPPRGWNAYDLTQIRGGVWHDVYRPPNRRVVVATTLVLAQAPVAPAPTGLRAKAA